MARILLVDDSETQRTTISQVLEKHGHEVITANDGETGVEYSKSQNPEIVLMDIVMPGLNGFQATRQISHDPETKHIPVILISNKDQETDKLWGTRQGAKGYLVKPIADSLLIGTINEFLKKEG